LAAERHHHILEAVHRKLARQLEEHVGYVRRPGCRRGQADIVLIFPLGQDHARRRVDQAGKHETLDVRHGIEERFGLFENHRCFLSRGGQAWVRSRRKTRIGYADGLVTNNELTTILSE
jgi:hypothetical protein